jgi:hypothetical protein
MTHIRRGARAITCAFGLSVAIACAVVAGAPSISSARSTAAVTYTAKVFMRGMKVTVPDPGWRVYEDHPGEFNLSAPAGTTAGTNIHFWLDPIATGPDGTVLPDVGRTPEELLAWLRQDADLVVSTPTTRSIAGGLRTLSVDLDLAASAPEEDPGCGGPCLGEFVFTGAHYSFPYGTGLGEPVRLYLASLSSHGARHTFLISVDAPSASAFAAVVPAASRILKSVRLPKKLSTG